MKISVITVVYNAEDTLEQTIMSVYGQSYNEIEYIIIDGSSSDATLSIINKHRDKISHVISEPDQGIYDAMNKGINISTGDVVGFLNADDLYYENNVVEKIIRCFETDSVDACYGDLVYVSKNNLSKIVRYWESCNHIEGLCKTGWMPAH
ncbi:MAG: glycosyltransferase, partial [Candidatus Dadabacteria bacterium]|nr:glycosyltransferase [Candidatus Dadabacteria bacterium]